MNCDAVIFDLDGTLLNTLADVGDSMNRALRALGYPEHPLDAYRTFVGDGVRTLVLRTLPKDAQDDETIEKACAGMQAEYAKRWAERTVPYAGISEMLSELTGRALPMAILSNKPDHFTKLIVAELLPHWKFVVVRGALPDVPRKPDPTSALAIARDLGVEPGRILYLGDTNTDMQTANGAGMFAVGATWGFRAPAELRANGAAVLIDGPGQLLSVIDTP
jgi:phosphoglycolate phosphatase